MHIITFILANLSSRCSDDSLSCLSFLLHIVTLLAARNFVAVDGSFRSLSFYVVAFLAACHSVAVANCSCPSLSFYVVALLAARHSVVVDCSGPSLSPSI